MIEVIKAGLLTTVQDLGRPGHQAEGVSVGGAVDSLALRIANLTVGNEEGAAALECTLQGPVLRFQEDACVVVAGAAIEAVPAARLMYFKAGDTLSAENLVHGCRAYIAVAGGIQVKKIFQSASTSLTAGFGGLDGRAIRAGDQLTVGPVAKRAAITKTGWWISSAVFPDYSDHPTVRIVLGRQADWFSEKALTLLTSSEFRVDAQSNRMGLRLDGPRLPRINSGELLSEAVIFGSVQVPASGQPIVLLADRQTLGGYPKIADVISVDLPLLAQLCPGDTVRFAIVTLSEAQALLRRREKAVASLRAGLEEKFR